MQNDSILWFYFITELAQTLSGTYVCIKIAQIKKKKLHKNNNILFPLSFWYLNVMITFNTDIQTYIQ